jgi:hypothetical protein
LIHPDSRRSNALYASIASASGSVWVRISAGSIAPASSARKAIHSDIDYRMDVSLSWLYRVLQS